MAPAEWTRTWRLPDAPHFVTVWAIHIGSYAGGLLGLVAAVAETRAERRRSIAFGGPSEVSR
ncbi:MAG: hypothetical protein CMN30_09235 [Sandaracinus sp.]|nr:hypothetical protein [Sandaracinus sp.]